jgi:hypothetical protein
MEKYKSKFKNKKNKMATKSPGNTNVLLVFVVRGRE